MNNLDYYLSLKYPIELSQIWDEDEVKFIYCAKIKELPGLKVYGDSYNEVLEDIEDAKVSWMEASIKMERNIPLPLLYQDEVSGKITFRMDKSLHRVLKEMAEKERISLNQLINNLVRQGIEGSRYDVLIDSIRVLQENSNETVRKLNLVNQSLVETRYTVPEGGNRWIKTETSSLVGLFSHN